MRPTTIPASWPQLAPREAGETAESYGLRAFAFAIEHGPELVRDDEALALADHCYPIIICGAGTSQLALDRLAEVQRRVRATQRRRAALDKAAGAPEAQTAPQAAQAAPQATNGAQGGGGGAKVPRRPVAPRGGSPAALVIPQYAPVADPF
jgi:hypothetical protein